MSSVFWTVYLNQYSDYLLILFWLLLYFPLFYTIQCKNGCINLKESLLAEENPFEKIYFIGRGMVSLKNPVIPMHVRTFMSCLWENISKAKKNLSTHKSEKKISISDFIILIRTHAHSLCLVYNKQQENGNPGKRALESKNPKSTKSK